MISKRSNNTLEVGMAEKVGQAENVGKDRDEFARFKRDTWNATDYDSWFKPARGQVIDTLEKAMLQKALDGKKYDRALDVGIGNGRGMGCHVSFD